MANKISIPSVVGMPMEGIPLNVAGFFQSVEEALKTIDNNAVYKDVLTRDVPSPTITALTAQGQALSVSGVGNIASGDDYAVLVSNVAALLQGYLQLHAFTKDLVTQLRGT